MDQEVKPSDAAFELVNALSRNRLEHGDHPHMQAHLIDQHTADLRAQLADRDAEVSALKIQVEYLDGFQTDCVALLAHAKAMRQALTQSKVKLELYRAEHSGEYIGGCEYKMLQEKITAAIAAFDDYMRGK